jgi:hypothetical protein
MLWRCARRFMFVGENNPPALFIPAAGKIGVFEKAAHITTKKMRGWWHPRLRTGQNGPDGPSQGVIVARDKRGVRGPGVARRSCLGRATTSSRTPHAARIRTEQRAIRMRLECVISRLLAPRTPSPPPRAAAAPLSSLARRRWPAGCIRVSDGRFLLRRSMKRQRLPPAVHGGRRRAGGRTGTPLVSAPMNSSGGVRPLCARTAGTASESTRGNDAALGELGLPASLTASSSRPAPP